MNKLSEEGRTSFFAKEDCFTMQEKKELFTEHHIVMGDCFAFQIQERENSSPLIRSFVEDDGQLSTNRYSLHFDAFWIDEIVSLLRKCKAIISQNWKSVPQVIEIDFSKFKDNESVFIRKLAQTKSVEVVISNADINYNVSHQFAPNDYPFIDSIIDGLLYKLRNGDKQDGI